MFGLDCGLLVVCFFFEGGVVLGFGVGFFKVYFFIPGNN